MQRHCLQSASLVLSLHIVSDLVPDIFVYTHSLPTALFRKYKPKAVVSGLLLLMLMETHTQSH